MKRLEKKLVIAMMVIWGVLTFGFGCDTDTNLARFGTLGLGLSLVVFGIILGVHWFATCEIKDCKCSCHDELVTGTMDGYDG